MSVTRADAKKRVVLPGVEPGDVFDVRRQEDEQYVLVRLQRPRATSGKSRTACVEAMRRSPLHLALSWEQLRQDTREP